MDSHKTILVAALNWGIGHATRCIPLINEILSEGHQVVFASDGDALDILKREFPDLPNYVLPGYSVTYPKNGNFIVHLLPQIPRILKAIRKENELTQNLITDLGIDLVISDNRYGVNSTKVPSIFISHQLQIATPFAEKIIAKIHRKFISDFTEIWVPDMENEPNLAGRLSHPEVNYPPLKYLGVLSRFSKKMEAIPPDGHTLEQNFSLAILSGPEPQRSIFESILLQHASESNKQLVVVGGTFKPQQNIPKNVSYYSFLESQNLLWLIQHSDELVARSGYSSIMDFVSLQKPAILVPTPGQTEQEYLARHISKTGMFSWMEQDSFSWGKVASNYPKLVPNPQLNRNAQRPSICDRINRF